MAAQILYLHQHFSTPAGATGTRSFAMARALAARGHAVTLACGRYAGRRHRARRPLPPRPARGPGRRLPRGGVRHPLRQRPGPGGARPWPSCATPRAPPRWRCPRRWDVVVASSTPLTVALPALAARQARGMPFVFEIRDPWPELPRAMGVGSPPLWSAHGPPGRRRLPRRRRGGGAVRGHGGDRAVAHGADPARCQWCRTAATSTCSARRSRPGGRPKRRPDEALAVYAGAHGRANGLDQLLRRRRRCCGGGRAAAPAAGGRGRREAAA